MGNSASFLKQQGYTLQEEIGQGVFGKTLRVKNAKDGKDYAIKVVNKTERVMTEVKVLKDLRHPFIVQCYKTFEDPDSLNLYIVMEYCSGGNLSKRIEAQKAEKGYFSEDQILNWFVEICWAVYHVHEKNILHRDIKPQNILLDERGRTRLADFGVAKVLESDMWALGCVLYELCELRLAFPETGKMDLIKTINNKPSPPISTRYSPELRDLVRDLLQKNPKDRPSAQDVLKRPFIQTFLMKKSTIREFQASVLSQHGYTQQEEIGRGLFSRTLRMKTKKEGKDYAIKVVFNSERVMDEVNALKDLRHPFIVQYSDFIKGADSLFLYIVMEYCNGGSLYEKLKVQDAECKHFSEDQILSWFVEICLAVYHVHEKNILHRDIKPQNILLDEHGKTRLGDFGVAKLQESGSAYAHTGAGTFRYLSPEEIDDKPYGKKSDMWALGCVLYELCELRLAFPETRKTVLFKTITDEPSPVISVRYSTELRGLVKDLLQKNPADRLSASDVLKRPFIQGFLKQKSQGIAEDVRQKLNKLNEVADGLEQVLWGTTVGSLAGGVIGAAGGITSIVGLILAPFTFGASAIVTGVGVAVAAAGGVTGVASNITNMVKERTDRSIMEKFIEELGMKMVMLILYLQPINDCFEDLEKDKPLDARPVVRTARGIGGLAKITSSVQAFRALSQGVRLARAAEVLTGVFAGLFLAVDIYFIVDDSMAIHAMRKQRSSATDDEGQVPPADPPASSTAAGEDDSTCPSFESMTLQLLPEERPDEAPSTDPQASKKVGKKALKTREFIQEIRKATAEIKTWLEKHMPSSSAH